MQTRSIRHSVALGLAILLSAIGACNCNKSAPSSADEDQEQTAEASEPSGDEASADNKEGGAEESSEAPSADLYPGMNFGKLGGDDRKTFVEVAKGELCPCPQSTESLHQCLQADDATCGLAKRSATALARGLQSGLSKSDVQGKLAKLVERAKKEYEFSLENTPHKGPKDAPVTIVEFADFQCPHCKKAAGMLGEMVESYDGKVVQYFMHFPLSNHGQSRLASRAAAAAQIQGKFWPMHDLIFEHQRSLTKEKIDQFARRIGLNFQKFKEDLDSKQVRQIVARDKEKGNQIGIRGTPAIYVNGREYMGAITKKGLKSAIETALESSKKGSE